ncbi:MAG: DUF3817 domain-containing protein [Mobilicoccus sp.]|nr:DUF3817 domain-containing protein [Mobilicoccus sp.]
MSPKKLFSIFAFAEMVTWALLLFGMFLRYVTQTTEMGVRIFGPIHGFVFLTYVVVVIAVAVDRRWPRGTAVLGVLSAVPPFMTVPFERHVLRKGLLEGGWQVHEGEAPTSAAERLLGWAVRNVVLAVGVVFALVVALFVFLLWLGPPPVPTP